MLRHLLTGSLAIVLLGQSLSADEKTKKLKVGDAAPAFKLRAHNGKDIALKDLLKKQKFTALVFHRSASW